MNVVIHSMPEATNVATVARGSLGDHEPPLGAHLVTPRFGYAHHGIYIGNGKVVHYAGLSRALVLRGPVEEVTLDRFADGREVWVKLRPLPRFAPDEIVARALSRLGEDRYRLTTNNCEHFCEWCLSGESRSEQVERVIARTRTALAAAIRRVKDLVSGGWNTAPGISG
jgi:hypothetical protein